MKIERLRPSASAAWAARIGKPLDKRGLASNHSLRRPKRFDPWRGVTGVAS